MGLGVGVLDLDFHALVVCMRLGACELLEQRLVVLG